MLHADEPPHTGSPHMQGTGAQYQNPAGVADPARCPLYSWDWTSLSKTQETLVLTESDMMLVQ